MPSRTTAPRGPLAPAPLWLTAVLALAIAAFDVWFAGQYLWSIAVVLAGLVQVIAAGIQSGRPDIAAARLRNAVVLLVIGFGGYLMVKQDAADEERRASQVIAAVRAYRQAQGGYPADLRALVPAHLPQLPEPRRARAAQGLSYERSNEGPTLSYVELAPSGRRVYEFVSDRWLEID